MASLTAYRPVGIEEEMQQHNQHILPNRRRHYQDEHDVDNTDSQNRNDRSQNQNENRTRGNYNRNHIDFDFDRSKSRSRSRPPPHRNEMETENLNRNMDDRDIDETDGFLGLPRKQSRGMVGVCCFALIVLVIGVVFLLGVCLGFYVRETQQDNVDLDKLCGAPERPSVDYGVLGGYHETLMYYIRGEEIRKFVDEFGTEDSVTGSDLERRLEEAVLKGFNAHKMDNVQIEEHELLVTYPNPDKPNQLQVIHAANNSILQTFRFRGASSSKDTSSGSATSGKPPSNNTDRDNSTLSGSSGNVSETRSKKDDDEHDDDGVGGRKHDDDYKDKFWKHPHVSFSPPGVTKAPLVQAHYGLPSDFDILESIGISVSGKTVLISLGKTSVADKVMEAERRGAVSVLLYWEVGDHLLETGSHIDPQHVPYESATTYVEDQPILWTPTIPCQTISTEQARTLISLMNASHLKPTSTTITTASNTNNSNKDDDGDVKESILVELRVNHKYRTQKIRNIVATIMGTEEQDHYVIVGAPRSSLPSSPSRDIVVSTSILSQLAKSIHYLHDLHLWRPRRGVKLVSWGGAEFSNTGALMHIMKRQHILGNRAVAYVDVGHLVSGNETIAAQSSSSLHQLLKEVAFDIRDPRDDGETIQSRWLQQSKGGLSGGMYKRVAGFGTDNTLYPFLHLLGIPTVRAQFQGRLDDTPVDRSSLQSYSYAHHYKFHIAMSRILVMAVLNLGDLELLPIDLGTVAKEFETTLWQTSAVLEDCTDAQATLEHVLELSENLMLTTRAFERLARGYIKRNDTKGMSMVNNVKMEMGRLFVTRSYGTSHHLLYPTNPDGSLQHATHLCQLYSVSNKIRPIMEFVGVLERIVQEADLMLKIGA